MITYFRFREIRFSFFSFFLFSDFYFSFFSLFFLQFPRQRSDGPFVPPRAPAVFGFYPVAEQLYSACIDVSYSSCIFRGLSSLDRLGQTSTFHVVVWLNILDAVKRCDSNLPTIVCPVQQSLPLPRAAKQITGLAVHFDLI